MDYATRQKKLRSTISKQRLDALLATHLPNAQYLCGFTGSAAALLTTERKAIFFTDGRYAEQARAEVHGVKVVIARQAPLLAAGEWLSAMQRRCG